MALEVLLYNYLIMIRKCWYHGERDGTEVTRILQTPEENVDCWPIGLPLRRTLKNC